MKDGDHREGVLVVYGHCGAGRQASARESPHDTLLVGAGLVHQLVGRTTAQSTIVARTPRGVVRQTACDLLGHAGVCAALVVEAATFSDVAHGE
jgi:hypothetical protein